MKHKLIAIIEKAKSDYGVWLESIEGVYGAGETVEEAKKNIEEALQLFIEYNPDVDEYLRNGDYEIEYQFDVQSFLNHFSNVLGQAALERITGINRKQLGHYASGLRHPRKEQVKKIEAGIRKIAKELSEVHFYV